MHFNIPHEQALHVWVKLSHSRWLGVRNRRDKQLYQGNGGVRTQSWASQTSELPLSDICKICLLPGQCFLGNRQLAGRLGLQKLIKRNILRLYGQPSPPFKHANPLLASLICIKVSLSSACSGNARYCKLQELQTVVTWLIALGV